MGSLLGTVALAAPSISHVPPVEKAELTVELPSTEFIRSPDGLFYVTGRVNGHAIRFLVDTGASVVMLTRADADNIGLDLHQGAFQSSVRTANGTSAMAWTKLREVSIAGRDVGDIDAAVPKAGLPVSLLGQNLLSKLGAVTIDGDRLRVHGRAASTKS